MTKIYTIEIDYTNPNGKCGTAMVASRESKIEAYQDAAGSILSYSQRGYKQHLVRVLRMCGNCFGAAELIDCAECVGKKSVKTKTFSKREFLAKV